MMKGKKLFASLTACVLTVGCTMTSGLSSVFAATGLGGFTWEATDGYQEGTTGVENESDATTVSFADTDNGTANPAGFCALMKGADWSDYQTLQFTVTNHSDVDINFSAAINTGTNWVWHQSDNISVGAGASKEVTLYLHAEEWWFWDPETETNNLVTIADLDIVQRVNMTVMSTSASATISGSVTVSDWALSGEGGNPGGGEDIPVEPKDGFYVDGTVLRDANRNAFEMRGTNYAYTWYNWENNEAEVFAELAAYGANCVRIVLSNGEQYTRNSASQVAHLIELCEKNNLVAVLEVHDVTGKDDSASLQTAAAYFADIKSALIGHENTTIINIANEWQGTTSASPWEAAYIEAIKTIRDAGLTHCIMCDAGGWGQGFATVTQSGAAVLAADPENNTMFSVHMYGTAGGKESTIKGCIDGIMTRGLCLCIGEFGWNHSDGDVQEAYIMQYCDEVGIGWLSWSWYGNGSPVEYLDMSSANVGGTLSDWGDDVINGEFGWKNTASVCSVFTGEQPPLTTTTTTETTTATQETTTTTTTVVILGGLRGDVNSDGSCSIADVVRLARYISQDETLDPAFTAVEIENADVNADSSVDSADITMLSRYLVGLETL